MPCNNKSIVSKLKLIRDFGGLCRLRKRSCWRQLRGMFWEKQSSCASFEIKSKLVRHWKFLSFLVIMVEGDPHSF